MSRKSIPFPFPNRHGQKLAGILDLPAAGEPLFYGVFGACFTCTKESHGAVKICRALAEGGAAMLRFDVTGVGASEGDFSALDFTTYKEDLVSASKALPVPPRLLAGHSISGTAALSAARLVPLLEAVATIGSPADPEAVIGKFRAQNLIAEKDGMAEVSVMGRPLLFKKSFVDDMLSQSTAADTAALAQKLFVFHAPRDNIVAFENARVICGRARNAELVALDEAATHLFEGRAEDAVFVARTLLERLGARG
jgi:pimeloyl-ACP methyl ester carboxylesterase